MNKFLIISGSLLVLAIVATVIVFVFVSTEISPTENAQIEVTTSSAI